jgi:hypothetical protein
MRFFPAWSTAVAVAALFLASPPSRAQNNGPTSQSPKTSASTQPPQQPPAAEGAHPGGQVIFSRSTDENGETRTTVGGPDGQPGIEMAKEPSVEDSDRLATTVTALALDVHLDAAAHRIAVRALVTVRNDGKTPLARIPLQISSSLNWEEIRVAGHSAAFPVATLNSDTDHTGQLHEAAVALAQPLAPGATLQLDTAYSGAITPSAQRLITIGTPEPVALHSDWDRITPEFTGLRGFGNVVWYPVSSVPVILGDGARLFDEMGRHKLRLMGARFSLSLSVEFPHGNPPTLALVNGHPVALTVADAHGLDADVDGVATARVENVTLGFEAPSLFVAIRKAHTAPNVTAWVTPDNEIAYRGWVDAAGRVMPFLERWLGPHPDAELTLLDLPDPEDAPYETGALLAASLNEAPPDRLDDVLAHALAHASIASTLGTRPAWLNEGLATFVESLWVEKRQGRDQALSMLDHDRSALALAEPASPGTSSGQPIAIATEPVYYRTKAAYIFWMLRDLTSDDALAAALAAYTGAKPGTGSPQAQTAGKTGTGSPLPLADLLKKAGATRDLSWFFSDWVDADKGLPDLTIENVFPNPAPGGTSLVAVDLSNAGYAAAEVPVTVRTAKTTVTERVMIPARGKVVQRILVNGDPTEVQVNDGSVPETEASVHIKDIGGGAGEPQPGASSSSSSAQAPAMPQ